MKVSYRDVGNIVNNGHATVCVCGRGGEHRIKFPFNSKRKPSRQGVESREKNDVVFGRS